MENAEWETVNVFSMIARDMLFYREGFSDRGKGDFIVAFKFLSYKASLILLSNDRNICSFIPKYVGIIQFSSSIFNTRT